MDRGSFDGATSGEQYRKSWVEMVSTLKKGATSKLMAIPKVKKKVLERIYIKDVEGASFDEPWGKGHAASTSSPNVL